MTKINLTTSKSVHVDEDPHVVIKKLQDAGKNYVEFQQIKPRKLSIWINPCKVSDITAEISNE